MNEAPRRDKLMPPRYQEIPVAGLPVARTEDGLAQVRILAGAALGASAVIETRTPVVLQDWTLLPGAEVEVHLGADHQASVYVFLGTARVGAEGREVEDGQLAVLGEGTVVRLGAGEARSARLLLLAGVPLREPVARHGPFVMSTQDEIRQAFDDYRSGRMGSIAR